MKRLPNIRHDWSALLQTLEGHTGWVNAIAFSKDGKTLASGSDDRTVRLWDPTTGQCRQTLEGHAGGVYAIAFSKDGKTLASGSDDCTVRLWDPTTGQCRQTLEGHTGGVNAIAFSKDGKTLASGSSDRTVRLWDPTTGQCRQTLEGIPTVISLSFSKDGCYLNTNRGIQILNSSALGTHHNLEQPTHVMFVNKTWVTQDTQNLLWLPPEYRDSPSSAVHDNILALGCRSGQVIVFEFAFP
jgi:WD40 repeat protein